MMNDMVWYRNSSDGEVNNVGDYDIAEVLEHLMHTIHLYGVPGAVDRFSRRTSMGLRISQRLADERTVLRHERSSR